MPLAVSSAYETKNAARARIPAYYVTFGDSDAKYSTHPEFLGGFGLGPTTMPGFFDVIPGPVPLEEGTTAFPYMAAMSLSGGRVRPHEGSSSAGSLQVTLLDFEGAITALIASNVIAPGRPMTLYTGFGDVGLQDFAVWMRGVIDDVQMPTPRIYSISAMERSVFQSQQVFFPAVTKLNTALSLTRLALDLDSLAFFTAPTVGHPTYVVMDDEAIKLEAFAEDTVLDVVSSNILNDPTFSASQVAETDNLIIDPGFSDSALWNPIGGFSIVSSKMSYTHAAGTGQFQTFPNAGSPDIGRSLSKPMASGQRYRLTYTLAALTGSITSIRIVFEKLLGALANKELALVNGTQTIEWISSPQKYLQISATSTGAGSFTLDDFIFTHLPLLGKWRRSAVDDNAGDWSFTGGGAVYTHAMGQGRMTQLAADLLTPLVPGETYRLSYTISDRTGTINTLEIPSGVADAVTPLTATDGSHTVDFVAHINATNFSIDATSTNGGLTLSAPSLIRLESFTGIMAVERGALGSMAAEHAEGAQVRELFRLTGHPLDIAVDVLTAVGNLGMEIDPALIDQPSFDAVKAETPTLEFEFLIGAQEEGKRWLEEQIFSPLGCFLVTTSDGTLALRSLTVGESTDTITDDHILEPPRWRGNFGEAINALGISYDHQMAGDVFHPASSDYGGRLTPEDASLLETDRRQKEHHLRGVRSSLVDTDVFLSDYAYMIFASYALGPTTVSANAMLAKHVIEQGDFVNLSCRLLPNRFNGDLGLTAARALVLSRDLDFVNGYINLELQLTGTETVALWAPDSEFPLGTETYGTATDEQREDFAFWAVDDDTEVEHLTNGTFASGASWTLFNDFSIGSGVLTYAHSVGGSARQAVASMAQALTPGARYKLRYTVVARTGDAVAWIPSLTISPTNVALDMTLGDQEVEFTCYSGYPTAPGDGFTLTGGNSSSGGFTLDNLSLVQVDAPEKNWR